MNKPKASDYLAMIWGLDMIRAIRDLPKWRQLLVRFFMGKYVWRELIGLRDTIVAMGYTCDTGYSVGEGCDYYKDVVGNLWDEIPPGGYETK